MIEHIDTSKFDINGSCSKMTHQGAARAIGVFCVLEIIVEDVLSLRGGA